MNDLVFKIFITVLSIILLLIVVIILAETIAHRKDKDNNRYRPKIKYLRSYKDGYAFADNQDLSQAMQVLYITSEYIEFSDTGINGSFERVWSW